MRSLIFCRSTGHNIHSFYLSSGGRNYFLFTQRFRRGTHTYYSGGVPIDAAIDFSRAHRNTAVEMTMDKIPMYIRYIEKEYGIEVLRQTRRRYRWNDGLRTCA